MFGTRYVFFQGGLGNQMFEYAFLLGLRAKGKKVKVDISFYKTFQQHNGYELDSVFGIEEDLVDRYGLNLFLTRAIRKTGIRKLISFDDETYDEFAAQGKSKFYNGYWQAPKYFENIENQLINVFSFKNIDQQNHVKAIKMQKCNSISIHIRRGDYSSYGMSLVGIDYYKKAISCIKDNVCNPVFFVFTDDYEESKMILDNFGVDYSIINNNHGKESYKDMYLMSKCKHNIIANSSFSWWGAFLNTNPNKIVIAPDMWLEGHPTLRPQLKTWIKI